MPVLAPDPAEANSSPAPRSSALWLALPILVLAFGLRLVRLGEQNIWWDEGLAIWAVRKALWETTLWTAGDVHPPVFFWLLWAQVRLAGESEFSARLVDVYSGVLTVALLVPIGRLIGGLSAGILGALLLAIARFPVWWSQELRMYAPATLFALAATYFLLRAVQNPVSARPLLADARGSEGRATDPNRDREGAGHGKPPDRSEARIVAGTPGADLARAERTPSGDPPRSMTKPLRGWKTAASFLIWLGYVLSAAAALWTVYLSAAVLIAHNLFVAGLIAARLVRSNWQPSAVNRQPPFSLQPSAFRLLRSWTVAQLGVLLLFLPWLGFASGRMRTWSTSEPVDPALFSRLYLVVISTGISTDIDLYWPWVGGALGGLAVLTALSFAFRQRPNAHQLTLNHRPSTFNPDSAFSLQPSAFSPGWLLILALAIVPAALVFYVTQPRGLFYSPRLEVRYFLLAAPAAALLAAGALVAIRRLGRPIAVLLTVAIAGLLSWSTLDYLDGRHRRDEYGSIKQVLSSYARPDDGLVLVSGDRSVVFLYYYPQIAAQPAWYGLPYTIPATPESAAGDVGPIAARHRRVWLVSAEAHLQDPGRRVQAWLDGNRPKVLDIPIGHNRVALYDRDGAPADLVQVAPQYSLEQTIDGRRILGFDLPATRFLPGEIGHVAIYWQAGASGPLGVQLSDSAGVPIEEWVFDDGGAVSGTPVRRQLEFGIQRHTPAGDYQVKLLGQSTTISLASVRVERTIPAPGVEPDRPYVRQNVPFGDGLALVGYELRGTERPLTDGAEVRPGDRLAVSLYWETRRRLDRPWIGFVHLLGSAIHPASGTPLWGQADGEPFAGAYPPQQWRPGQVVRDDRSFAIDRDAPAGPYEIEVGFYWPPTGERIPTSDGTGRAILGRVMVVR